MAKKSKKIIKNSKKMNFCYFYAYFSKYIDFKIKMIYNEIIKILGEENAKKTCD